MGQFVATGLVIELSASRKEMEKGKISSEELKKEIEKSMLFDMGL